MESAIEQALKGAQQSILTKYETAIRSARKDNLFGDVLLACALARTNELGEFAAQDARDHMQAIRGPSCTIPTLAQHLKAFCDAKRGPVLLRGGVKRLYRYRFLDPLLQPFIIMQGLRAGRVRPDYLDAQPAMREAYGVASAHAEIGNALSAYCKPCNMQPVHIDRRHAKCLIGWGG